MSQYTLTAEVELVTCRRTFTANDDASATFDAIAFILDEASASKNGPWAKGRIKLMNSRGKVLQEMDAK
jgi:hypothetical protein